MTQKANLSFKNRFPYISVVDEASSDFQFGMQLRFAKARRQIPLGKVSVALGQGSSPKFWASPLIFVQRLKLATSNLACSWGLPRPIIKITQKKKWAWPWAKEAPEDLEVLPFIFLNGRATGPLSFLLCVSSRYVLRLLHQLNRRLLRIF